jgi:hypothetical protein
MRTLSMAVAVLAAPCLALAQATAASPAPDEASTLTCSPPAGAGAGYDWAGRYRAEEGVAPSAESPSMVMSYQADVFRDPAGAWRAFVWISGQTTFQEWATCGVAGPRTLRLEGVRVRMESDGDAKAPAHLLTLERRAGTLSMRVEGGSYLLGQASIDVRREPLPPWAGRYTYDSCGAAAQAPCWRYAIEVTLADDGWRAVVEAATTEASRRYLARGEDGELARGAAILDLTLVGPAPGETLKEAAPKTGDPIGRIARGKDGTLTFEPSGLPTPPGRPKVPLTHEAPVMSPKAVPR